MATKRPILTMKGRNRSSKARSNVLVGTNNTGNYVTPDLGDTNAESTNKLPSIDGRRRMSDTIKEDEEFGSSVYGIDSEDESYMGSTQADLQLGRIQHLEPEIQVGIKVLAQGGSIKGISKLDAAAALEEFGKQIEGSPSGPTK
jgi:hypothetical protein